MPPHKSHDKGLDVDILIIRKDHKEGRSDIADATYSRELTQKLVDLIHATAGNDLEFVFTADTNLRGSKVKTEKDHTHHVHVRLRERSPEEPRSSKPSQGAKQQAQRDKQKQPTATPQTR